MVKRRYAIHHDDKTTYYQGNDEDVVRMICNASEVKITRDDKPGNWCDTFIIRNVDDIKNWFVCCQLIDNEDIRYYVRIGKFSFQRLHEYDRDELMKLRRPKFIG